MYPSSLGNSNTQILVVRELARVWFARESANTARNPEHSPWTPILKQLQKQQYKYTIHLDNILWDCLKPASEDAHIYNVLMKKWHVNVRTNLDSLLLLIKKWLGPPYISIPDSYLLDKALEYILMGTPWHYFFLKK